MNIRIRLIAAMLLAVILPMTVLTVIVVMKFRDNALEDFKSRSSAEIRQIDKAFSLYLNGLAEDARFLSSTQALKGLDASVTKYLGAPKQTFSQRQGSAEARAFDLMSDLGDAHPDLAYVFLGIETGGYIQWPTGEMGKYDPRLRPWYKEANEKPGEAVRSHPYKDVATGAPLIDYLHTFTTDSGVKGVVGVDVTLKTLTEMVRSVQFGEQGYLILLEQTGVVLADSGNPDNNFKNVSDLWDAYLALFKADGLVNTTLNEQPWFATVYTSPELGWKFIGVIPSQEVFSVAAEMRNTIIVITLVLLGIFAFLAYWISNLISSPIVAVTAGLEEVASGEGDLTRRLEVDSNDESGKMASAFNRFVTMIHTLVTDINQGAENVNRQAQDGRLIADHLMQISDKQSLALEQVVTAFNEVVATSDEVAHNCNETAKAADQSQQHVQQGQAYIEKTTGSVNNLEQVIEDSNQAMAVLAEESKNITGILDTIRGIAEQTNLLALNAAIEAARAGEQGRGFAVVADEVRTLAARTAESTEEIDSMISSLVTRTSDVSDKLSSSLEHSKETVEATEQTREVFFSIQESVSRISDMANQIATASEQQHLAAEEINRNITSINDEAGSATQSSKKLKQGAESLSQVSGELSALVSRFRLR